jgi:hypothetical protein
MSGSDVHDRYWKKSFDEIKVYCEKDVLSLFEVSEKIYGNKIKQNGKST